MDTDKKAMARSSEQIIEQLLELHIFNARTTTTF